MARKIDAEKNSNTKELARIAEVACGNVIQVQTANDLQKSYFDAQDKVGIVAGASTPSYIIEEVKNFLSE